MLLPVVERQRALAVRRPDQRLDPDIARPDRDDRNAAVGIGAGRDRPLDESGLDPFLSALLADADLADLGIAIMAGQLPGDRGSAGKDQSPAARRRPRLDPRRPRRDVAGRPGLTGLEAVPKAAREGPE